MVIIFVTLNYKNIYIYIFYKSDLCIKILCIIILYILTDNDQKGCKHLGTHSAIINDLAWNGVFFNVKTSYIGYMHEKSDMFKYRIIHVFWYILHNALLSLLAWYRIFQLWLVIRHLWQKAPQDNYAYLSTCLMLNYIFNILWICYCACSYCDCSFWMHLNWNVFVLKINHECFVFS